MRTTRGHLYAVVVATGVVFVLAAGQTRPGAQPADPAIRIGATDLGGVVTSAERSGSRRLGDRGDDRPADEVRQDRRDRRSRALPHARSAARRTTACGCAATGSSIRRRCRRAPGKILNLTAVVAPSAGRGGRVLPGDLLVLDAARCRTKSEFPGTGPDGNGIARR